MSKTVNWGVVGAGMMGKIFPPRIRQAGGEVKVYLGVDKNEASEAADKINLVPDTIGSFEDYDTMLGRDDINGVVIAVPNFMHDEMAIKAAKAGKHVICEKPLAITPAKARAVYRALMKAKVAGQIDSQYRFAEVFDFIRQAVKDESYGKPTFIEMKYIQDWQLDPETAIGWRPVIKIAGKGKLVPDLGAHTMQTSLDVYGGKFIQFNGKTYNVVPVRYRPKAGKVESFGGKQLPPRSEQPELYEEMDMLDGSQFSGDDIATAEFVLETAKGEKVPGFYRLSQVDAGNKNGFEAELVFERGKFEWNQEHPNQLKIAGKDCQFATYERGSEPGIVGLPAGHPQGYGDEITRLVMDMQKVIGDAGYGQLGDAALEAYTGKNMGDAVHVVEICDKWLKKDLIPL